MKCLQKILEIAIYQKRMFIVKKIIWFDLF